MTLTIAVLMTAFNRRDTTLRALRGLVDQKLPSSVKLCTYVVDDGSTDGTAESVRAAHPEVNLLHGNGSLFWTGGMHLADSVAWSASPDYLLWLNDDVDLCADAVAVLLESARACGNEAIVVGAVLDPSTSGVTYGAYRRINRPLDLQIMMPNGQLQDADTMNGNVVLIPAAVRRAVGSPDLTFSHNMADMDYAFRARGLCYRVVLAPTAIGRCALNLGKNRWQDATLPLRERLALVRSVKGLPPREWWHFTRRHTGRHWLRYFVSPYATALLPSAVQRLRGRGDALTESSMFGSRYGPTR